ncbi:MAG: VOC family protein, partial [Pseudomonadota bacterium]|nr:VOC family protein [Pseudomonadota bacterium]
ASARFRTVHARRDRCPEGRVYFCEHATPELVWRPEWQAHANGAQTIAEMVLVAADPAAVSARYAAISGGNPLITVLSPAALGDRYGVLARPLDGGAARLAALVVATDDLAAARTMAAAAPGVTLATLDDHRFAVRVDDFDTVIEFVTPAAARAIT